jgi:hypothetical protein
MTDETMNLRDLLEKTADTDFLREMIGFTAQRLMELEVESLTGAPHGSRAPDRLTHRNGSRARVGDPCGNRRTAYSEAPQGQLLSGLPRTTANGREGTHRSGPGSLRPGHLHTLGR